MKSSFTSKISTLKSSSDWADDAFGKKPSLQRQEKFIGKNSHLIGMPSAKELVNKGIDLVEMDANLLRQIEWLWEHIIELKKENDSLKSINQKQEKSLKQFNARMKKIEKILDVR